MIAKLLKLFDFTIKYSKEDDIAEYDHMMI